MDVCTKEDMYNGRRGGGGQDLRIRSGLTHGNGMLITAGILV